MVVKMDQEEVFSSLRRQDFLIAILLLISLVLVLISIKLAIRKITSPIKALTTTVQKFAKGDFKDRATVSSDNEVGVLAKAFNSMALEIDNYKILKEKNQKEIERKVLELQGTQERLKKSEYENTTILERSIEGFWTMDQEGCILEVNNSFCAMLGYSRDALLGTSITHFDVNESHNVTADYIKRIIQVGHKSFEGKQRHKEGHCIDVEMSIHFASSLGNIFFCFQRDISGRKKVEEELRLQAEIIANMAEGVYLVRAHDGVIVFANPKFEDMFGYDSGEMVGQHVSIVNTTGDKTSAETASEIIAILEKTGVWQGDSH